VTTIFITDDMITDGVVNGYFADQLDFSQVTIPIKFTYTPYAEELVFTPASAPDPELTGDRMGAQIYVLSRFNDSFSLREGYGATNIYGGDGNDRLGSSIYGSGVSLNGGNGDDVLDGSSPERDHLRGDAGNDVLLMLAGDQGYGGTGSDRFVLLDLKGWDSERHRHLTGMENGPTLEFARRLGERKRPIWVRFVLVPGLTDDAAQITEIARFAAGLGVVERVDVLPFHQMGRFKWKQLGLPYALDDVKPPSTELVERTLAIFRGAGLTAY